MTTKKQNPAWKPIKPAPKKPTGIGKAVAAGRVLKADADYAKAVRSGNPRAVRAAAARMRTAQRKAGHPSGPKLASIGEAVKARAAYDKAMASGDSRATQAAATKVRRFQAAAGEQDRDRRGRFT